jgi:hypothetical protein
MLLHKPQITEAKLRVRADSGIKSKLIKKGGRHAHQITKACAITNKAINILLPVKSC